MTGFMTLYGFKSLFNELAMFVMLIIVVISIVRAIVLWVFKIPQSTNADDQSEIKRIYRKFLDKEDRR